MKLNALLLGMMLMAVAVAPARADWRRPAWTQDKQLTVGFAVGHGFVDKSDSEIVALQGRVEFRRRQAYFAVRGSWVAQQCNTRPNPTELSLLGGISIPLDSDRNRINLGLGVGRTTAHGASVTGLPCEFRIKFGVFGLTAFSNFNSRYSFHGICASLDFPIGIF